MVTKNQPVLLIPPEASQIDSEDVSSSKPSRRRQNRKGSNRLGVLKLDSKKAGQERRPPSPRFPPRPGNQGSWVPLSGRGQQEASGRRSHIPAPTPGLCSGTELSCRPLWRGSNRPSRLGHTSPQPETRQRQSPDDTAVTRRSADTETSKCFSSPGPQPRPSDFPATGQPPETTLGALSHPSAARRPAVKFQKYLQHHLCSQQEERRDFDETSPECYKKECADDLKGLSGFKSHQRRWRSELQSILQKPSKKTKAQKVGENTKAEM